MLGGGKNRVPETGGLAVRAAARSLVSPGAPRAGELSLPLASLFRRSGSGSAVSAGRSGGGGGENGRALPVLREIFPIAGHGKVNFSPAIELVLFPPPWGNRLKKKKKKR